MPDIKSITDDFIASVAANTNALTNAKKISSKNGFKNLTRTDDDTLIFGEYKGYKTSVDFMSGAPVFRCSCPSRQIPCKHCLALMFDFVTGKNFETCEVPEDIAAKRKKIEDRAKKAESTEKKPNKSAAAKKLKKQREGLEIAEKFVNDVLSRGVSSINNASVSQYKELAKQLGDYYLPEPQSIMFEIINVAESLSEKPSDDETARVVRLCVKLSVSVRKCMDYIDKKLESGEVLPEDSPLYEAMGNVWKLAQLKELGLYKKNSEIIQLSFTVINDTAHGRFIDSAYWVDISDGEICRTENKRPYRATGYIKEEDSFFGVFSAQELFRYPGGLVRRVRFESAETRKPDVNDYAKILTFAEKSLPDAVKKAKNELKNTLSDSVAAMLIKCDGVEFTADNGAVLSLGGETVSLRGNENYPEVVNVLRVVGSDRVGGECAIFGEFFYDSGSRKIYLCPLAVITAEKITRLC